MLSTDKQTDYRFKLLYALGMIFIVAGHCKHGGVSLFYEWFPPYSFHLGLFAFSSGYFYKEESESAILKYCTRKAKHLLLPLYVWNVFYALLTMTLGKWGVTIGAGVTLNKLLIAPITDGHQFGFNLGGWFVVPLFMVQMFNVIIRKKFQSEASKYKEHLLFLLYLLLGILGIQLANRGYRTGWWLVLVRMLFFVPFYGAGIYYKKVLEKRDNSSNSAYFFTIIAIQLVIIMVYKKTPAYRPSWCDNFTEGPFLPYIVGFLGIAFWLRIARILEPSIGKSRTVQLIADNTFSIMIHQFLGFMIVKMFFAMLQNQTLFADFDINGFKTDIWYYYIPGGMSQMLIVYLFSGLFVPILIQRLIDCIKCRFTGLRKTGN